MHYALIKSNHEKVLLVLDFLGHCCLKQDICVASVKVFCTNDLHIHHFYTVSATWKYASPGPIRILPWWYLMRDSKSGKVATICCWRQTNWPTHVTRLEQQKRGVHIHSLALWDAQILWGAGVVSITKEKWYRYVSICTHIFVKENVIFTSIEFTHG